MRAFVGHAFALFLAAVEPSCVPSSATRADDGVASSTTASAPSDATGSQDPQGDQALYTEAYSKGIAELCAPDGFIVTCYFHDQAECQRAFAAQWPACVPDAGLPDSSAARWAAGEELGECASKRVLGKLKLRLDDPVCKSRFPKTRIENPYMDASTGAAH